MGNLKAISLHIGLNSINPDHYCGSDGSLIACENDANDMASIARNLNYNDVNVLLTKNATRDNVISRIKNIASNLEKGDYFLLTYSGHGGQIPDTNGDEADFLD